MNRLFTVLLTTCLLVSSVSTPVKAAPQLPPEFKDRIETTTSNLELAYRHAKQLLRMMYESLKGKQIEHIRQQLPDLELAVQNLIDANGQASAFISDVAFQLRLSPDVQAQQQSYPSLFPAYKPSAAASFSPSMPMLQRYPPASETERLYRQLTNHDQSFAALQDNQMYLKRKIGELNAPNWLNTVMLEAGMKNEYKEIWRRLSEALSSGEARVEAVRAYLEHVKRTCLFN